MLRTIFSYAFRPFYAAAALYGALIIVLWYPLGFQGNSNLPTFFWHGHEMIWGYTGAIIVGFLLTAVSNWTHQPPLQGMPLFLLFLTWVLARIFIYLPFKESFYYSTLFDLLFYLSAALSMAISLYRSNNYANIGVPIALLLFGGANLLFFGGMMSLHTIPLLNTLQLGLLGIAAFIGLIGSRVIPFFTSITLRRENRFSKFFTFTAFILPLIMMIGMIIQIDRWVVLLLGLLSTLFNLYQLARWWDRRVLYEPLLWSLYVGFLFTTLGVAVLGYAYAVNMRYLSLSTHLIAVGGMGSITLGMMARTALGHTGRAMILPKPMVVAFLLIILSLLLRLSALFVESNLLLLAGSGVLFSFALLIYAYCYLPILLGPSR